MKDLGSLKKTIKLSNISSIIDNISVKTAHLYPKGLYSLKKFRKYPVENFNYRHLIRILFDSNFVGNWEYLGHLAFPSFLVPRCYMQYVLRSLFDKPCHLFSISWHMCFRECFCLKQRWTVRNIPTDRCWKRFEHVTTESHLVYLVADM